MKRTIMMRVFGQTADNGFPTGDERKRVNAKADDMTGGERDEELLERIRAGNDAAAETLIRRYQEKAYAIAWSMCDRDAEEAKDTVQDAFIKALKNIGKFRGQSSFYTWFYRILVNTCLDRRRKQRLVRKFFLPWNSGRKEDAESGNTLEEQPDMRTSSDPLAVLSGSEFGAEVQKLLGSLSEKQRTVFQLKVFHGMSIAEIAEVMNAAQGTVKSHLFRATQYLKENLKEWQDMKI